MDDHGVNITGLPLSGVDGTIRALELIEVIVFGAALLFIGVAGTAWIRLSLRPLGRITATAAEVTQMPLASGEVTLPHRVPDADPRTEVGQLGEAFNRMLGHVEQALGTRQASEARLRQFIADASHELRTPLAGIRGYTELALRGEDELDPELRRALSRVDAESARMSRLVDDLLLLARLDAGRPLAHEQVDLTRLAIDVTNDARVAGPRHRWVLDLPAEPVTVTGDQHRLHQVLANLLTNARAHTPPGTTVTVRLIPASAGERGRRRRAHRQRRWPGNPGRVAGGRVGAVRPRRQRPLTQGREHGSRAGDRGRGGHRPSWPGLAGKPPRQDDVQDLASCGRSGARASTRVTSSPPRRRRWPRPRALWRTNGSGDGRHRT